MANFWQKLPKPFFVLAPMEEVTDTVFRRIVAGVGRPDVMFTEFTNVDAIVYAVRNSQNSVLELPRLSGGSLRADFAGIPAPLQRLVFTQIERPLVAQIWGTDPVKFLEAAKVIKKLDFDGIDINFGCPDKKVVKMGAGGGVIGNDVSEIIKATKEGAKGLPVSVKTRIGNKSIITERWINYLLDQKLAAITIHGRTVAELSSVPAHWEEIEKAIKLRNQSRVDTLIVGNGDVVNLAEAREMVAKHEVDGVMIGRGIFTNPALFSEKELDKEEKIELYKKQIKLFKQEWGETKNWQELKKFMKVYVSGWPGAVELRQKLARTKTVDELVVELG